MKLINKLIFIIIGVLVVLLLVFTPKDNGKNNSKLNVAYGNDASGVVINYVIEEKKLSNTMAEDIDGVTMNDC